ncbi:MAG: LysR family transcriptional regulator [Limisphaerales bacterium]
MQLMKLESLKTFCDLAETQSFTKAAQINDVTQSAVSQQITALERTFKSLLIERSRKEFRLTREGETLYEHAKEIIRLQGSLYSKMEEIKDIISGTIRVATIYSIGLYGLPTQIKKLMEKHPTVKVHVEYRRFNEVYDDVLRNAADLGLVAYPNKKSDLAIVPLRQDPLVFVCHPQHPLAAEKSVRLKSLAGQKMIGFEPGLPTRKALDRIFREHRVVVRYAMEFDNIETLKRAVEIDAGVAILPESTIRQEVAKQTLVALPIAEGNFYRPLAAIHKKNKELSPTLKHFLTLLKEAA